MQFEIEHVFDAPIEAVEAAMFDPAYPAFLLEHHEVLSGVSPQSMEDDGARVTRRIHFAPLPAFEHIAYKKVPAHWFEFVEESVWDKRQRKLVFKHFPTEDKVAERLDTRGEVLLESLPSGQTRRRTRTEIQIKNLPFMLKAFAPVAEQMLGREAKRMFDSEARVLSQWLAQSRPAPGATA
jgi:hypothetical protein